MSRNNLIKKDGTERDIEEPSEAVKSIQRKIIGSLRLIFEDKFEDFSYCRRGKSSSGAVEMFEKYRDEGYQWISSMDIKNCFPSINPDNVLELIDSRIKCIPGIYGRSGLPQGHPISPVLANVYLNQFDKSVSSWPRHGCKIIRYLDDIVLMSRKKSEVEAYSYQANQILRDLGLEIREDIRHINEGVEFLGYTINRDSRRIHPEKVEEIKQEVIKYKLQISNLKRSNNTTARSPGKGYDSYIKGIVNHYGTKVKPLLQGLTAQIDNSIPNNRSARILTDSNHPTTTPQFLEEPS